MTEFAAKLLDARRLTGPNLLFKQPAAVLDIGCDEAAVDEFLGRWKTAVVELLDALDWERPKFSHVALEGGVSVGFTSPIDRLYAATSVNEWAFAIVSADSAAEPLLIAAGRIREEAAEEKNGRLLHLAVEAQRRDTPLLWDDDFVSIGHGRFSRSWPARELPQDVDWASYRHVPVGIVTGTNGKTTSVRLATHILRGCGYRVGQSSTDWIAVDEDVIDHGDWSGPGGARAVLRDKRVDAAILEAARGGLLRRGLGVEQADAALITNIAEDHLGDFGSRNLDELLSIKWIVSRAVRESGRLVLNADDSRLVSRAASYPGQIVWFSLEPGNPVVRDAIARGSTAFLLCDELLVRRDMSGQYDIAKAGEIPITLDGRARHNVANALAAAALTHCMGVSDDDIAAGLKRVSQDDNPGRCNLYDVAGVRVLVDFAHNPHAMRALFDMASAVDARRKVLCFGQAGDRPDSLIEAMTRDAYDIGLDRVIVSELAPYHRGREHGEVFQVMRRCLREAGLADSEILHFDEELESLDAALEWARPGDLVIMLALGGAGPVQERIEALQGRAG